MGSCSLPEIVTSHAERDPHGVAYTFLESGERDGACLTWATLDRHIRNLTAALRGEVPRGARVLLLFPPGLDFVAAFFGCLYAGVLAVPVLPPQGGRARKGVDRLASIVADAAPRCTLTSTELHQQLAHECRDGLLGTIELGTGG